MPFDQKVAQKIFSDNKPALFLIHQGGAEGDKAVEALHEVAHKLKGEIFLSVSNIDEGLGNRLAEFVGVAKTELPAVRIIVPGG